MDFKNFILSLNEIKDQDALTLGQKLSSGEVIVVADKMSGSVFKRKKGLKYLFRVEGNRLFAYKLSESTDTKLVLTLCVVFPMDPNLFKQLFEMYISEKDYMYSCDESLLDAAEFRACVPNETKSLPLNALTRKYIDDAMNENPKIVLDLEGYFGQQKSYR